MLPFLELIFFICNAGVGTAGHGDAFITSWWYNNYVTQKQKPKQGLSLADVNVSLLKAPVRSRDCSFLHQEMQTIQRNATTIEM